MEAYFVKSVSRLRKDLIVDGKFLNSFKIGTKLKYLTYEFVVKGVILGERNSTFKNLNNQSIVLEPIPKIEDEQILINKILETI